MVAYFVIGLPWSWPWSSTARYITYEVTVESTGAFHVSAMPCADALPFRSCGLPGTVSAASTSPVESLVSVSGLPSSSVKLTLP